MKKNICILGATGDVGRELIKSNKFCDTRISSIISSSHILEYPNIEEILNLTQTKEHAHAVMSESGEAYSSVDDILNSMKYTNTDSLVDVSSMSKDSYNLHQAIIDSGRTVVTANKNASSLCSFDDFKKLTKNSRAYLDEATVMAGSGAITLIKDCRNAGDDIISIKTCPSGTIGYVLGELRKGDDFSEIVRRAQKEQITETDPHDDFNGIDVARKSVILARYAGYDVSMDDVIIKPLVTDEYKTDALEGYLKNISSLDEYYKNITEEADSNESVLCYVSEIIPRDGNRAKIKVGIQEVSKDSKFGSLNGTENIIVAKTEIMSEIPHVIMAMGAGAENTAAAVRMDIARIMTPDNNIYYAEWCKINGQNAKLI